MPLIFLRHLSNFTEPIGGAKPKFSLSTELNKLTRAEGSAISLQCPAQAYPIPAFRLVRCLFNEKMIF